MILRTQTVMRAWVLAAGVCVAALPPVSGQVMRSPSEMKGMDLRQLLGTQVISVSRTLQDWQSAPTAISVLTAPEIERSGAVRIPEVLRLIPGLNVSRYIGNSYSITARGFGTASVNKIEVLMDGRSLYTPLFSGVFWDAQDMLIADIERIEVVRGPGAALWGANAMNGVINIVSKDARDTQGSYLTGGAGTEERAILGVRHGGRIGDDTWFRVYGKHATRDDQATSTGASVGDGATQNQAGFRIDHGERAEGHATLQGDIYSVHSGNPGRPDSKHDGWNLLGRWDRQRSDGSEFTLRAYYEHSARDVSGQFSEVRDTVDFDAQWRGRPDGRHDLVAGLGYRNSWDTTGTGSDRTFQFSPSRRRIERLTGFVQDSIKLEEDRWTLYAGSKVEYSGYSGLELQPGLRLAFTPDRRQTWWGGVSRAVRTPTRVESDLRFRPAPETGLVVIQGNPEFTSEEALAWELGYRVQPHEKVFVDLATYYTEYDDLRTFEPTPPAGLPLIVGNGRAGRTYGAELVVTVQPTSWWRLRGNINHLNLELRLKRGSQDATSGALEANDSEFTGSLQSTMNLARHLQWDFFIRGATGRPNPELPGYVAVDMRLAWQPRTDWEISLIGQNLLSPHHAEFPGEGAAQPEVERAVLVRTTFRF